MNAHIINIPDENYFINTCVPGGFLGVGIYVGNLNARGLSSACNTSYSMYADMKTIRVGDIIFVHSGQKIYGVFKAESEFVEDSTVPQLILSSNIHYYPNPNIANSGWQGHFQPLVNISDYRRLYISHFIDNDGQNICYQNGIDSTEVFDLKYHDKIFTVPERWKYADAARTVRPLMKFEAGEILKLIEIENADNNNRFTIHPVNLQTYFPIEFILDNRIVENEKIIEGWICSQIGRNPSIDAIFNDFSSFGNNIPIGYLKFIDILGYKELPSGIKKYKIIEVKNDDCIYPDNIIQLIDYINKAAINIVNGNFKLIEGFLVAKNFSQDCINFVRQFNQTGRNIKLVSFNYNPPLYNQLILTQIA
jgi:hypothetical protein